MRDAALRIVFLAAAVSAGAPQEPERPTGPAIDYYGEIQPLFAIHCVRCHGPDVRKNGLRLDLKDSLLKGGRSGRPAVVPGKPGESEILRRVASTDPDEAMPPKGEKLKSGDIARLKRWIEEGAAWPERDTYWAWSPPQRPPLPAVRNEGWVRSPVDRFILAKLEANGLRPAPPAGKIVLLRRVAADLIGVPPTPEEAEAFLRDDSPGATEALLDRLLADPRYGERWGRHWLDLVRYAESEGFEYDKVRPHAWRYRDYVIRSLNQDKPYDRFIREQIAGDELYPDDPDALVATGFARLSPWDTACKNKKQVWQDFLNDATDTTGAVFLGLTVGCARCHDHKYDRITQEEYYSLQAFFVAVRRDTRDLPGDIDPEPVRQKFRRIRAELKPAKDRLAALRKEHRARLLEEKRRKLKDPEKKKKASVSDKDVNKSIDKAHPKLRERLEKRIKELEPVADLYRPRAEVVREQGTHAPKARLLRGGSLGSPGKELKPGFIAALTGGDGAAEIKAPEGRKSTGRRSALARWLASPDNPMTARVIVNRVWLHHFGHGIVRTPSDFGRNGSQPSHPELLDWLACELVRNGWRLKPLHKLIMTSAAFLQASGTGAAAVAADPENRWFGRMDRRRLEGEAIRDSILSVSGRLNPERGGPGVYPKLSKEAMDVPEMKELPKWGVSPERDGLRRTIYVFQRRSLMLPIVQVFDGADMSHTCAKRDVTTVAPQALSLFNSAFSRGEARHFAARVAREAGPDLDRQIERAYRLALTRPPTAEERALARAFVEDYLRRHAAGEAGLGALARRALIDFCHVLLNTNEFVYVD